MNCGTTCEQWNPWTFDTARGRCMKGALAPVGDGRVEDERYGSGWISTVAGMACIRSRPEQLELFADALCAERG